MSSGASALRRRFHRLSPSAVIGLGLFWVPVGMAVMPGPHASSVFHWSLALLLYLPSLWLLITERGRWLQNPHIRTALFVFAALLVWACISLTWASGTHRIERIKVLVFVMLYVHAWLFWGVAEPERITRLLYVSGLAMALCALIAMLAFPWRDIVWTHRMTGFNLLDGPNLSAYAMGASLVWLLQLPPARGAMRMLWLLALLLLAVFVGWTDSRGAWLALFACLVAWLFWQPGCRTRWFAVCSGLLAMFMLLLDPVQWLPRGLSYRPQIFAQALALVAQHPWRGLGMGSKYTIVVGKHSWTHSHNLFTDVAIEMGLPGLALWLVLWVWTGWCGWRARRTPLGRVVLALWIFASVGLQFDGPSLLRSTRAEWLLTWLPLSLALLLATRSANECQAAACSASARPLRQ